MAALQWSPLWPACAIDALHATVGRAQNKATLVLASRSPLLENAKVGGLSISSLPRVIGRSLLAGAATGGFEAIHLRVVLAAQPAARGCSILLFAGTVVESAVRINPDLDPRVPLKMDHGCGRLRNSKRDQRPFPRTERRWLRRSHRRPQQRQRRHDDGCPQIQVGAPKAQLHAPVRNALY